MRILIIISLLLLSKIFYGQDSLKQNVVIKYAPLSLLDPYFCNLQFGIEYRYNNKISLELDISNYFGHIMNWEHNNIKNRQCFKIKPEIKYFWGNELCNRKYFGCELFFTKDKYEKGSYFSDSTFKNQYYAFEKISSYEFGLNTKLGIQYLYFKKLQIDYFIGIAVGYVIPTYIYKIEDPKAGFRISLIFSTRTHEEPIILPIFGIKIGYKFNVK